MTESDISTEDILDAALEAFAENGFGGTSVREIARSLGGSHNLIPNRVGTKEDLWYAAVDRGVARMFAELATLQTSADSTATDRLRAVMARFIEVNHLRPALMRVVAREASNRGPRIDHLYDAWIRPFRVFGEDALATLRANGDVGTDSVGLVFFFMAFGGVGPAAFPALAERFDADLVACDEDGARRQAEAATALLFDGLVKNS